MRLIRFLDRSPVIHYGWAHGDWVGLIEGDPYGDFRRLEANIPLQSITLLAPVTPSKVICVGRNYAEHAREQGAEVPDLPVIFLKPPTAVIGPGETILLPPQSKQVDHEAELGVVIGKRARWVIPEQALDYVLGYVPVNDVTARDLQKRDGQWTRAKGFDTFCPVGPWVETEFDGSDTLVSCHVNGVLRQMGSTRDMIFSPQELIAFISSIMTLEPGDLILTGTPAGVGPLAPGDRVRVTIEGIGTLENPVGMPSR